MGEDDSDRDLESKLGRVHVEVPALALELALASALASTRTCEVDQRLGEGIGPLGGIDDVAGVLYLGEHGYMGYPHIRDQTRAHRVGSYGVD